MICEEIIHILESHSPESYACDWDNVGLLVGSKKQEIKTIFIALDATKVVIEEAKQAGADLILTHHPLIFKGLKKVGQDDFIGVRIVELIKSDIACYAMHTNFDVMGMADLAAETIGLTQRFILWETIVEGETAQGIGRVGDLSQSMTLAECALLTKNAFELERVKVYGDLRSEVKKVAICPGSGRSVIGMSIETGAQVLITGDISHHDGIDAVEQGLAIIDAGHYGVEQIFISYMKRYLEWKLVEQDIKVVAQTAKPPFSWI